jgi:hypothetical protein
MWDDEAFDEPEDGELDDDIDALLWSCTLDLLAIELWLQVGDYERFTTPVCTPLAGWRWNRPTLSEEQAMDLTLSVGQARLERYHNEYLIAELMQACTTGGV